MRRALAIICGLLFFTLTSVAQSKSDQDKTTDKAPTSKAQIVGTAEITKIDAKKRILQVRSVVESNSSTSSTSNPDINRRNGGGGYPGGGYPGWGYPGVSDPSPGGRPECG